MMQASRGLLLGDLAGRDVLDLSERVAGLPRVVSYERPAKLRPDDLALLVKIAFLDVIMFDVAAEQLFGQGQVRLQIVGMRDALKIGGLQFVFGVAETMAERAIDFQEPAVEVDQCHADGRVFERAAKGRRVGSKSSIPNGAQPIEWHARHIGWRVWPVLHGAGGDGTGRAWQAGILMAVQAPANRCRPEEFASLVSCQVGRIKRARSAGQQTSGLVDLGTVRPRASCAYIGAEMLYGACENFTPVRHCMVHDFGTPGIVGRALVCQFVTGRVMLLPPLVQRVVLRSCNSHREPVD